MDAVVEKRPTSASNDRGVPAVVILFLALVLISLLVALLTPLFGTWRLEDYANTFYPASRYLLRGENVYLNAYPHPTNGREYPPYAPLWMVEAAVPLGVWSLPVAEALRFLLDLGLLPLLAYLTGRWAGVGKAGLMALLLLAPWHLTELSTGQWTVFVLLGVLLAYWALKSKSSAMLAVALWLMLAKPHVVSLILVASLVYAWRGRFLGRTLAILALLGLCGSAAQPSWPADMLRLYVDRLAHPRPTDSILLLPGYPYGQFALLAAGIVLLVLYLLRRPEDLPGRWLWGVLVVMSLVGSLHSFIYDWMLLMIPLALFLKSRPGVIFLLGIYLYALAWAVVAVGLELPFPTPAIIPGVVLIVAFATFGLVSSHSYSAWRASELSPPLSG